MKKTIYADVRNRKSELIFKMFGWILFFIYSFYIGNILYITGTFLFVLGGFLNVMCVYKNKWNMPLLYSKEVEWDGKIIKSNRKPKLKFLADRFYVPISYDKNYLFSIGDLIIYIGMGLLIIWIIFTLS